MTITDEIREETTFNHIKGLLQNGITPEIISKSFGISIQNSRRNCQENRKHFKIKNIPFQNIPKQAQKACFLFFGESILSISFVAEKLFLKIFLST